MNFTKLLVATAVASSFTVAAENTSLLDSLSQNDARKHITHQLVIQPNLPWIANDIIAARQFSASENLHIGWSPDHTALSLSTFDEQTQTFNYLGGTKLEQILPDLKRIHYLSQGDNNRLYVIYRSAENRTTLAVISTEDPQSLQRLQTLSHDNLSSYGEQNKIAIVNGNLYQAVANNVSVFSIDEAQQQLQLESTLENPAGTIHELCVSKHSERLFLSTYSSNGNSKNWPLAVFQRNADGIFSEQAIDTGERNIPTGFHWRITCDDNSDHAMLYNDNQTLLFSGIADKAMTLQEEYNTSTLTSLYNNVRLHLNEQQFLATSLNNHSGYATGHVVSADKSSPAALITDWTGTVDSAGYASQTRAGYVNQTWFINHSTEYNATTEYRALQFDSSNKPDIVSRLTSSEQSLSLASVQDALWVEEHQLAFVKTSKEVLIYTVETDENNQTRLTLLADEAFDKSLINHMHFSHYHWNEDTQQLTLFMLSNYSFSNVRLMNFTLTDGVPVFNHEYLLQDNDQETDEFSNMMVMSDDGNHLVVVGNKSDRLFHFIVNENQFELAGTYIDDAAGIDGLEQVNAITLHHNDLYVLSKSSEKLSHFKLANNKLNYQQTITDIEGLSDGNYLSATDSQLLVAGYEFMHHFNRNSQGELSYDSLALLDNSIYGRYSGLQHLNPHFGVLNQNTGLQPVALEPDNGHWSLSTPFTFEPAIRTANQYYFSQLENPQLVLTSRSNGSLTEFTLLNLQRSPVAKDNLITINQGEPLTISATDLFIDYDAEHTFGFADMTLPDYMQTDGENIVINAEQGLEAEVNLVVSDNDQLSTNHPFTLQINGKPYASLTQFSSVKSGVNDSILIDLSRYILDPENDQLSWQLTTPQAGATIQGHHLLINMPASPQTLNVIAQDDKGASTTVALTVEPTDHQTTFAVQPESINLDLTAVWQNLTGDEPYFAASDLPDGLTLSNDGKLTGSLNTSAFSNGSMSIPVVVQFGHTQATETTEQQTAGTTINSTIQLTQQGTGSAPAPTANATNSSGGGSLGWLTALFALLGLNARRATKR